MVKVLKTSLYMSNEKNFLKNFDGLTKEESERLLELERSLELAKAKPKIEQYSRHCLMIYRKDCMREIEKFP